MGCARGGGAVRTAARCRSASGGGASAAQRSYIQPDQINVAGPLLAGRGGGLVLRRRLQVDHLAAPVREWAALPGRQQRGPLWRALHHTFRTLTPSTGAPTSSACPLTTWPADPFFRMDKRMHYTGAGRMVAHKWWSRGGAQNCATGTDSNRIMGRPQGRQGAHSIMAHGGGHGSAGYTRACGLGGNHSGCGAWGQRQEREAGGQGGQ